MGSCQSDLVPEIAYTIDDLQQESILVKNFKYAKIVCDGEKPFDSEQVLTVLYQCVRVNKGQLELTIKAIVPFLSLIPKPVTLYFKKPVNEFRPNVPFEISKNLYLRVNGKKYSTCIVFKDVVLDQSTSLSLEIKFLNIRMNGASTSTNLILF